MRPNLDEWTIVLLGGWNPKIFSPGWVADKLSGAKDSQAIEIEAGIGPGTQFLKYRFDGVLLIPQDDRLILGLSTLVDEHLERIEEVACHVLRLLPETPLTAVGVNFGFIEDDVPQGLRKIFDVADRRQLSDTEFELARTELRRQFTWEKGVLNLKQVFDPPEVEIKMNWHLQTDQWENANAFLCGQVLDMKRKSLEFLTTVYGLSLDEEFEEVIPNVD